MDVHNSELLKELQDALNTSSVLLSGEQMKDYIEDMGGFSAIPWIVVRPDTEEQLVSVVKFADRHGIPIVPRGAGTSLTGAVVLENSITVDISKFNKVIKVDTINWYVCVQAGVILEDLNNKLKKLGFFFPPDPASGFACTVGGAISEGSGGMRCLRYGTVKDWVLSARVLLPNGEIVNLGEPLYKNRAGYDLLHLIVGSEGTLAIVLEANLKIIPVPEVSFKRVIAYFSDWKSAGSAIRSLRESRIQPFLLEFLDRDTIQTVNRDIENKFEEAEALLLIDLDSSEAEKGIDVLQSHGASRIHVAKDEKETEEFYQARAMAYLSLKGSATGVQIEDVVVPIDRLAEYLETLKEIASKHNVRMPVMGHAGDGNVHPVVLYEKSDDEDKKRAQSAIEDLCRAAIRIGGSITGEHGVGSQKVNLFREQLLEHNGKEVLDLMKSVKDVFDKKGIMNPGKYVQAA